MEYLIITEGKDTEDMVTASGRSSSWQTQQVEYLRREGPRGTAKPDFGVGAGGWGETAGGAQR